MPSAPLLDFETIDLSRVISGRDEIRKLLKQRGTFEMLDGILHFDAEGKLIVGCKDIRADDWWTKDHIPGRPIFPGALMIESGAQLCSYDYLRRCSDPSPFIGFGGLDNTRFRGLVEPGSRMIFAAEMRRIRNKIFMYYVQGFVDRQLVFETEVIGVVV